MKNTVKKYTERRIRNLKHISEKQLRKLKQEPITNYTEWCRGYHLGYKRALQHALEILREETYINELLNV